MDTKDVNGSLSFDGDIEPLLPDGWKEGDDLFAGLEDQDAVPGLSDGADEAALDSLLNGGSQSEDPAPTTSGESGNEPNAGDGSTDTGTDGGQAGQKSSRKLTLKVNHQVEEIDVGAMSDEDLAALLQKGRAFDQMKEAESKRTYREVYQQQIDEGQTEAVAKLVAKDAVNGKVYSLTDDEEQEGDAGAASSKPAAQGRDFKAEVDQLRALYPDFKEMPNEVALAVSKGANLLTAYLAYREKQGRQAAATLKRENQVLKQNAASAAKAPVKGVTGGNNGPAKEEDIFSKAFDAGLNW